MLQKMLLEVLLSKMYCHVAPSSVYFFLTNRSSRFGAVQGVRAHLRPVLPHRRLPLAADHDLRAGARRVELNLSNFIN